MTEMRKVQFDVNLLLHIKKHRNDEARAMLNAELAKTSDNYGTLLHYAALNGNAVITRHLIDLGSDVDSLGFHRKTPLMLAMELENAECIEILLDAGADYEISDVNGDTALSKASDMNDHWIVELFYRRFKAKVPTIEELVEKLLSARFTLPFDVLLEDIEVVELMLQRGYDIDSRDSNGDTALHDAAREKNLELAKMLVDHKANVNALGLDSLSPLMCSAGVLEAEIVQLLLEGGADPNYNGSDGGLHFTPLRALFTDFIMPKPPRCMKQLDKCVISLLRHGAFPQSRITIRKTLDDALKETGSRAVDYFIGHMVMLEMIGSHPDVASIERCEEVDDQSKVAALKETYKLCQKVLKVNVFRSMSLLDLLIDNEYRMRLNVRDETFDSKVEKFCDEQELSELLPYYHLILTERIEKASRVVKFEDEAILVICDIFQRNENECYVAARKIVGCLNERDLEHLCQVTE